MKRTLKILGILILILLLVALVLPFVVNVNAFRPTLESDLSSALGRQVKVGNLKLSILSGSVSAENISIADDPAFSNAPFVKAKALAVGVELMPLIFSKTLHVTDLTLEQPQISLLHSPSGKWNFSSIGAAGEKTASQKNAPSGGAASQNLTVNQLTVSNGRVQVGKVPSSSKPLVFDKVNISVRNFSFTSQFPFTLTADLPGGGDAKLDGKAGPMNATDAAQTPLQAHLKVSRLNLASSGFVEPSTGIAGLADFDGTVTSDGRELHSAGTVKADKLKLAEKGSPAGRPVEVKYAVEHNLQKNSGTLTQGDVAMGKAVAHLTGAYQMQGDSTLLNMRLLGQGMPVDDLEAMLPALGVVLPSGSSLKGGTLSANLGIAGPVDKLVITGPVRLADTRLAGFDMGSKMSAISALSGAKTGSDTSIQNLSTDARMAPEGIRTDNISLIIPSIGQLSGNGAISPGGALDYKMTAKLSGGTVTGLSQMAGLGGKTGGDIPFFIRGTTSNPSFMPDVKGMLRGQLKSNLPVNPSQKNAIDALSGLFKKKNK
jgi:AsmA protein